jgi:hypothetical protein
MQIHEKAGAERSMISVSSNDPEFTQAEANKQWTGIRKAIADGKYRLRETKETSGIRLYLYDITLPDGKVVGFGSSKPMEKIRVEELSGARDK